MKLVAGSGSWLEEYLLEQLTREQWSPEQIAGDLRRNHGMTIWPQVIYASPEKKQLLPHLRRGGSRYHHRHGTNARMKAGRSKLPSIHDRGLMVEQRVRLGDWEGDTVVGLDHKDRILTHVERACGECRLGLVLGYDAHKIADRTVRTLAEALVPVRTITYDRGSEFADWERVQHATDARIYVAVSQSTTALAVGIYFADAYSSWQRGTDENLNGLVRQYYPKRSDFKGITPRQQQRTERKLNTRPRKRYNYRTPIQQREFLGRSVKFGGVAILGRM
jgi:IS30 family transposase